MGGAYGTSSYGYPQDKRRRKSAEKLFKDIVTRFFPSPAERNILEISYLSLAKRLGINFI